ncbi:MAG: hypothetical protein RLZZ253_963, partial [Verrucomicrobiota bacterium]
DALIKLTAVEMPETPKGAPELPAAAEIAKLAGDAVRGKTAVGVCYACHKIGGQGVEFGPDLTTFAKQQPPEVVIQAIVKPSNDISHGYEGSLLVSKEGVKIAGMVLSNGDPVLMKCMGNMVQTVPRSRVASLSPLGRSLMYDPAVERKAGEAGNSAAGSLAVPVGNPAVSRSVARSATTGKRDEQNAPIPAGIEAAPWIYRQEPRTGCFPSVLSRGIGGNELPSPCPCPLSPPAGVRRLFCE